MSTADVIIIDSGGANLASLVYALDRLGARSQVSSDVALIAAAPRVLLPGVGAARDAMDRLAGFGLLDCIRRLRQPLLGICLGMQLLFEHSEEGDTPCLGILPGRVQQLHSAPGLPVPHMGWNTYTATGASDPLLAGLGDRDHCYFVHSYAAPVGACTTASTDYGVPFSAVVRRANFHGTQFHPERSASAGARLLQNFLGL